MVNTLRGDVHMNESSKRRWSAVNPALCESKLHLNPIAPCEILPKGAPGLLEINQQLYAVSILGFLPAEGEPCLEGFRLTKGNGEAHDLCRIDGRLECTCGDWLFRRAAQCAPALMDCKHIKAVKECLAFPLFDIGNHQSEQAVTEGQP
jgi:hypothetical protein